MAINTQSLKISGSKIAKVLIVFGVSGGIGLFNFYPNWATLPIGAVLYGFLDYISHNYADLWGWLDFIFGKPQLDTQETHEISEVQAVPVDNPTNKEGSN